MKTLLIGLIIFSILLPSILATNANIYRAGDFDKNPEQLAVLAERDMMRINWEGKEHQIHVRKVYYPEKQKVDLTAFIEGSEVPYYTTITSKTSLQLDFERDDVYDLKVSIFNFLEEDGKKFVVLKFEKIDIESPKVTTNAIKEGTSKNKFYYYFIQNKIYMFIGLILLSLGLGIWKRNFFLKKGPH